jgi:hypothetical protein
MGDQCHSARRVPVLQWLVAPISCSYCCSYCCTNFSCSYKYPHCCTYQSAHGCAYCCALQHANRRANTCADSDIANICTDSESHHLAHYPTHFFPVNILRGCFVWVWELSAVHHSN